jgi:hypothetical protein
LPYLHLKDILLCVKDPRELFAEYSIFKILLSQERRF